MPKPPQTVHSSGGSESEHVVVKQATAKEVDVLRQVGKNHPNIIRYIDSLGEEIIAGYKTSGKHLLIMEKADRGTLKDLIAHVRGLSTSRSSAFVLPADFLYSVLAGLIGAMLYLETSLTEPIQHIDLHVGNVAFSKRPSSWPIVKILDFNRVQSGEKGEPSPAIGVFARSMLQDRLVLPQEFVDTLEKLSSPLTSLDDLASIKALASARSGNYNSSGTPQWLTEYFGL